MPRLSNINIPNQKRIIIALTYIYGIGNSLAKKILKDVDINQDIRVHKLKDFELVAIQNQLNKYSLEGDVRRKVGFDIKRLKEIACYRGIRHRLGLPVRGQITQKNARTRKGPRKTVANKKKSDGKK